MDYKPRLVGDAEMEGTLDAPTVAVNRFIVSTSRMGFRIAFGESLSADTPIHARVNLLLEPFQAYELKNVLEQLLQPFLPEIEAARAAEAAEAAHGEQTK